MSGREYEKTVQEPGALALPVISNQKMNQYLKEICELCGFNEPIHITGHADYKSMKPYIDIAEKAKTDAMDAMEKALGE